MSVAEDYIGRLRKMVAANSAMASRGATLARAEDAAKVAYQALPVGVFDGLLEYKYEQARIERERARRMYSLMSIRRDRLVQGKAI